VARWGYPPFLKPIFINGSPWYGNVGPGATMGTAFEWSMGDTRCYRMKIEEFGTNPGFPTVLMDTGSGDPATGGGKSPLHDVFSVTTDWRFGRFHLHAYFPDGETYSDAYSVVDRTLI
jgi:hypothetical protein